VLYSNLLLLILQADKEEVSFDLKPSVNQWLKGREHKLSSGIFNNNVLANMFF